LSCKVKILIPNTCMVTNPLNRFRIDHELWSISLSQSYKIKIKISYLFTLSLHNIELMMMEELTQN